MTFNESDVRAFYRWLGHKPDEYTEIRIISWPPGGSVVQRWVQDEDSFVELCKEWSGKRQCYAGVNPRSREAGSAGDVSRVVAIPFDVDSGHPSKEAATDEEVEQAKEHVISLVSWMRIQGYGAPLIAMSGNGYHVLQKVNLDITDSLPSQLEAYFHEAPTEGMDSIFDLPRIIKIPGTMSVKGVSTPERPHRLSRLITEGDLNPDEYLIVHIAELEPYTAPIPVPAAAKAKTKRKTSNLRPCFKVFVEEGGRLASIGSEDNLLRLALVTEAHSKRYNRNQIIDLFSKCEDFDPKITREKVDHQLGKLAVEGIKVWSCKQIHKHGGCLGESCSRYKRHVAKYVVTPPPDPDKPTSPDDFFDGNEKFIPNYLVDYIVQNTGKGCLLTPTTKRGGDVTWCYNVKLGIFRPDGLSFIQKRAKQLLGDKARSHMVTETARLVQIETYIDRKEFEEDPDVLVLQNGVYHLDTDELTKHDPQYHAKSRWSITYDPDAECPAILKFLGEVIENKEKAQLFIEWLGYHLIKDYRWAEILMLIGDGENGKGVLLVLMQVFLGGSDNVSNVDLLSLTTNRFAPSLLYGKTANIYPDVGAEELKVTGRLKALTGNEYINVEGKHQDGFSMRNHAKLTFSTNKLPKTPDESRAFHRRWRIINCPNFFVKGATPEMAAESIYPCDPDVITKITTPQELSGLFNMTLEARKTLLKNGGFSDEQTVEEKQALYEELMDNITAFINCCINTDDPNGVIPKDDLHRYYYQFCKMKGYTPELKQTLTKKLKPRLVNLGEGRRLIQGKRVTCWTGISMNPDKSRPECDGCPGFIACMSTMSTTPVDREAVVRPLALPHKIQYPQRKGEKGKTEEAPREDVPGIQEHPSIERSLVTADTIDAAMTILQENNGSMSHQLLWKKLEFYGHTSNDENDKLLRADPRLKFAGITVILLGKCHKNEDIYCADMPNPDGYVCEEECTRWKEEPK